MWAEVVQAVASNTLAIAIVAYLFRSIIKHWLDKDINNFKNRIELNAQQTISKYQSELEKERIRLQIQYGGIFEKQAEAVLELYRLLVNYERAVTSTIHGSRNKETFDLLIESLNQMTNYFDLNQVLFPGEIEEKFENFRNKGYFAATDYWRYERRVERGNLTQTQIDEVFSKQDEAMEQLKELPDLKRELMSLFGKIIGTIENSS